MSYGDKYQLQFTDLDGNVIKIVISQKDFAGVVSNVIGSENPSESGLDRNNDDRFETLKPTFLKLNLFVEKAGDFDEFYDIDNFEYKVIKYINTIPEWTGFISDEVFTEPYSSGKYIINLTATDGLSILKGRYTELTGRVSHLTMIRECLDAIGFGLNIVDCISVVEAGHAASGGPLFQTYFDDNLFGDKEGKRWTLDKVLKDILSTYGANIIQVHNKWVISSVESYFDGISGYEYTSAGVYIGEYADTDIKAITAQLDASEVTLLTGGSIQKRKGWKELSVKTTFGKIEQEGIILNGSFNDHPLYSAGDDDSCINYHDLKLPGWVASNSMGTFPHIVCKIRTNQITGDYVYMKEPGILEGDYYVQTILNDSKPLEASASKLYVFSFLYTVLADVMIFSGKQSAKLMVEVLDENGTTTHWLSNLAPTNQSPAYWATSETYITTPEVTLFSSTEFNWQEGKFEIIGFPGGRIRVTLYSENKLGSLQYNGVAYDEIRFYSKDVAQAPSHGTLTGYPTDNPNFVTIPPELEFIQTDAPVENAEDAILFFKNYLSLADGTPTSSWSTNHHSGTLSQIYLFACLEAHGKAIQVKNTPGRGLISPNTRLQAGTNDHGAKRFQIVSYTHQDKTNQFTAEIVEIIEPGTIAITTNFDTGESSSGGSGTNGVTTSQTDSTTDDRLVSMLELAGIESGAPGKLYAKYHDFYGVGSTPVYYPMGGGEGNYAAFKDYRENIWGMNATVGVGAETKWCGTCRLFTIGNGVDTDHRSNAFVMYKSGYTEFTNAIVLRAYLWRDPLVGPPWEGSLQYITDGNYWSFQGYYNDAWHDFIMDDSFYYINLMDTPSSYGAVGTFPFMDTADTLGWSAYTMPIELPDVDSVPVITSSGTSSWQPYSGGGGGDAWLLGGNELGQKDYLGSTDNYAIAFKTNDIERMSIGTNGLVNPLFNVRLENTTHAAEVGIIYKGTVPWIHNFNYGNNGTVTTDGFNVFIGGAGNLTMGATATEVYHASYNTFSGYRAGYSNTIGYSNTFFGYTAGAYIANGSTALTITTESVFLGASTKAKIDNSTNEIVIGYGAIGNGSNTVTIGNTSITDNYLTGNLQIGNKFKILEGGATPTKFTTFQGGDQTIDLTYTLPTAYPGATGYVLSSTDAGVLSWIEMSASTAYWKRDGVTDNYYIESAETLFIEQPDGTDPWGYIAWGAHDGSSLANCPIIYAGQGFDVESHLILEAPGGAQIIVSDHTQITGSLHLYDDVMPLFIRADSLEKGIGFVPDGAVHKALIVQSIDVDVSSSIIDICAYTETGYFGLFANPVFWNGIGWEEILIDIFQDTQVQESTDGYVATIIEDSSGHNSVQWMPGSSGTGYWTEDSLGVHYGGDVYLTGRIFNDFSGNDEILLDSFFDSEVQSATAGYVATIVEESGVKTIQWIAGGTGSCPWTEDSDGVHYDGDIYVHDIYYDQDPADRYLLEMLRYSNVDQASDGQVLTIVKDSDDLYLHWAPAGAGSCYWDGIAGGISYNSNVTIYDSGYTIFDSAIVLPTLASFAPPGGGDPLPGTMYYAATGHFVNIGGVKLFHNGNWEDLVGWDNNYFIHLVDVNALGAPSVDSILKVASNRTLSWTALSSIGSKWTVDTYGIYYSAGHVGVGGNSDSNYEFTVTADYAIQGIGTNGVGIMGTSNTGHGVIGNSNSGYGLEGVSGSGYGVYGVSGSNYGGYFTGLGINVIGAVCVGGVERIGSTGIVTSSNGYTGTYTDANNNTLTFVGGICTGNSQ